MRTRHRLQGACYLGAYLFCEELADISEGLELQGITRRVEKEHGGLFADFALEANVWLDDEIDTSVVETLGESVPFFHRKNDTEVGNGNIVAVDRIVMLVALGRRGL